MTKSKAQEKVRDIHETAIVDTGAMDRVPFFCVCIPTYNRANFLPEAIESVLSQDFTDFELIICDNASTDNTEEVVKQYQDNRIRYVRYKNLVSMYANHNRCIDLARSEWLVFLHSDDLIKNSCLSLYQKLIENLSCVAVFYPSNTIHNSTTGYWIDKPFPHYIIGKSYQFYRYPAGTPSGAVYKTDVLRKIQFNELSICADLEILIGITNLKYKVAIINQPIIEIGVNAPNRYTTKWHLSGGFIKDVSDCLIENLNEQIFAQILLDINNWSSNEVSFLMLCFTYQNRLDLVTQMKQKVINKDYQKYSYYRHIVVAEALGYPLYKMLHLMAKKVRVFLARS